MSDDLRRWAIPLGVALGFVVLELMHLHRLAAIEDDERRLRENQARLLEAVVVFEQHAEHAKPAERPQIFVIQTEDGGHLEELK